MQFADGRLDAPTLGLLGGLSARYEVVGALSASESNGPLEELVVCRSELSEELQTENLRHTLVQHRQGLHHLDLLHAHLQNERSDLHTVQLQFEPFVACPRR